MDFFINTYSYFDKVQCFSYLEKDIKIYKLGGNANFL